MHVTGGEHLNSDNCFKSRALDERKQSMKLIKVDKALRLEHLKCTTLKNELVAEKYYKLLETSSQLTVAHIKISCKWKIVKNPAKVKCAIVQMHIDAPDSTVKTWSNEEEDALSTLKENEIQIKDTTISVSAYQIARGITNKVQLLKNSECRDLLRYLLDVSTKEM